MVDASPCIGLARIGQLRLLAELFSRVLVAQSVVSELWAGQRDDRAWEIIRYGNVEVHTARVRLGVVAPSVLSEADLDTIDLARTNPAVDLVIVDERAARRYAKAQGLKVMGTVGLVALATTKGLLVEARPWFAKLVEAGFRVDDALLDRTLAELGEAPLSIK